MSSPTTEFEQLMRRVRSGCPRAAQEVFDLYSEHVRRVIRRRLHQRLRSQYDSVDFNQSVWASFFQISPEQYTFATPDDLIAFLSRLALNKVIDETRKRLQTHKHDVSREQSLDAPPPGGPDEFPADPPGHLPTPSQLAIAEEHWVQMLQGQGPRNRRVLEMLRQGHTHREIAEQVGTHPKVIQRLLKKLLQRLDLP
jgi:RNA polymerase sigma factor (sigma-70 family)